jgi:hypothetical protein
MSHSSLGWEPGQAGKDHQDCPLSIGDIAVENDKEPSSDPAIVGMPPGAEPDDSQRKVDAVVMRIARLIGRQMARETFLAQSAANDNRRPGE